MGIDSNKNPTVRNSGMEIFTVSPGRACLQGERVYTLVLGLLTKRVKVISGLQANFTGKATLSPGLTLSALLTSFVKRDILYTCNVQDLK